MIFLSQVNGIDTVRIPVSLEPYEDQSAKYKKQLKMQPRAGTSASEPAAITTVSEDNVVGQSSEGEEITAPSNESSKKD